MIAAVVVLFFPDPEDLQALLRGVGAQVDRVILIDNTPLANLDVNSVGGDHSAEVSYHGFGENLGVGAAQNRGISIAAQEGCTHVLLLDQDSVVADGAVRTLMLGEEYLLQSGKPVAAVCPLIIDHRAGARPAAVFYSWGRCKKLWAHPGDSAILETDNLIASGSLIRLRVLDVVGAMREDLFIEYVDTEWIMRAKQFGYSGYCVTAATLHHSFGDETSVLFGRKLFLYSLLRYKYKIRNSAFLLRLRTMGCGWRFYQLIRIPYQIILFSWLSDNRLAAFVALVGSLSDGVRGKLGKIQS